MDSERFRIDDVLSTLQAVESLIRNLNKRIKDLETELSDVCADRDYYQDRCYDVEYELGLYRPKNEL